MTSKEIRRSRALNAAARGWLKLGVRRLPPIPSSVPRLPLHKARVALLSTGGALLPGQPEFSTGRRGDASYRRIPSDVEPAKLRWFHPHYDTTIGDEDPDSILPLRLFRTLAAEGVIGSLAPTAISMMGYIPRTAELIGGSAPEIGELMQGEAVDVALLCPA